MYRQLSFRRVFSLILLLALLSLSGVVPVFATPLGTVNQADTVIDNLVYNIAFDIPSPNIVPVNTDINFTFDYTTNYPGGVRIFGRPMTHGALTPAYAAHGSSLYTGTGSSGGFFTLTSTPADGMLVDGVRFQVLSADQSVLLMEKILPVYYLFSNSPNLVHTVQFMPDTANIIRINQHVNLSFNYRTNLIAGTRIFNLPFTGLNPSPFYAVSGSLLYTGTGSDSQFFTITAGAPEVANFERLRVTTGDQSSELFRAFLPVHYWFDDQPTMVWNFSITPRSPNILRYGDRVNLSFFYVNGTGSPVVIFARPLTNGQPTPSYAAHPSPFYAIGSGSTTGWFTITSGPALVDGIRLQVLNNTQTTVLYEQVIPVHYQFGMYRPPFFLPAVMR